MRLPTVLLTCAKRRGIWAVVAGLVLSTTAWADPITTYLVNASDTFIASGPTEVNSNLGANTNFEIGRNANGYLRRGLVDFDLSGIPAYAQIQSATLLINITRQPVGPTFNVSVYRALRDWVENEATWYKATALTNWDQAGASSTTNDRAATASATRNILSSSGTVSYNNALFHPFDVTADVASMVHGTAPAYGWILLSDEAALIAGNITDYTRFVSAENTATNRQPTLRILYTIPEPATLSVLLLAAPLALWRRR